jgi:hypothetical protein
MTPWLVKSVKSPSEYDEYLNSGARRLVELSSAGKNAALMLPLPLCQEELLN